MSTIQYAGFWLRFVAYIIDYIIIQIIQSIIILPLLATFGFAFAATSFDYDWDQLSEGEIIAIIIAIIGAVSTMALISMIILVLYYSIMESSKYQATLGKMALGLIVTDEEGNRLNFWKAFLRQVAKILSGMILMIGYIMAGLTEKKQALHDMIAGALVVKKAG
ncbi:MAG: putative RDD family membrane protein YckC [Cyclobacteriaceae bacterium]|jgi:uncharacterized RDD family membrane protein YckC